MEQILQQGVRPKVIHVEVSPLVPPPISYRPLTFDGSITDSMEALAGDRRGHMRHCSLSAFQELLEPFAYRLVYFNYHDATFGDVSVLPPGWLQGLSAEEIWYGVYFCHPMRWLDPLEVLYKQKCLAD